MCGGVSGAWVGTGRLSKGAQQGSVQGGIRWQQRVTCVDSAACAVSSPLHRTCPTTVQMLAQPDEEDVETVPARVPPGLAGLHRAQAAWLRFRHSAVITPPVSGLTGWHLLWRHTAVPEEGYQTGASGGGAGLKRSGMYTTRINLHHPQRSWSAREHCSRHPVGDAETAAARRG